MVHTRKPFGKKANPSFQELRKPRGKTRAIEYVYKKAVHSSTPPGERGVQQLIGSCPSGGSTVKEQVSKQKASITDTHNFSSHLKHRIKRALREHRAPSLHLSMNSEEQMSGLSQDFRA